MYPEAFEQWYLRHQLKQKQEAYKEWLETCAPRMRPKSHGKKGKKKNKNKKKDKQPQKARVKYAEYINSIEWRRKSRYWRKQTGKCEKCGATERLECHHKHYKTLGNERRRDIMVVCHACHCELHSVTEFKDRPAT